MEVFVIVVSWVINVLGSFATDGAWKTAGLSVAQFYWNSLDNQNAYHRNVLECNK